MAAEVLATAGLEVTVVDRAPSVGRKFLLAGRGGLNLTHTEPLPQFLGRYGAARPSLDAAIERFDPDDLRAWSAGLGQETFVGSSGRVFPAGFRATPLLRSWLARLAELGVQIVARTTWTGWTDDGALAFRHEPTGGVRAETPDVTVLALGGASWPRTGSDGSWVELVAADGIDVTPLRPANCGFVVDWTVGFADRFGGVPLKNVAVTFGGATVRGEAMITSTGIEGGAVYGLAATVRDALDATGEAELSIDLQPDLDVARLTERISGRRAADSASTRLRRGAGLSPVAVALMFETAGGTLPAEPRELAERIKAVPLGVRSAQPIERAISSAGGISFDEVDERFMLLRRPGVFVAGEMLDWEATTGGYLLQAAFSTGVAAARGALDWMASLPDG